jgi:TetR/AcrR family transcriptional regulator
MASSRRIGAESSETRTALLDAAERLMLDQGYAAVTSRRVAAEAGLKPQLVHYYFRTMDDLFVAMFRRRAEIGLERQAEALASDQPLRALWDFSSEPGGAAFAMELSALANHRKSIRSEIARYAEQFRVSQLGVVTKVMRDYDIDADEYPPAAVLVLITSLSRLMVMEEKLGMATGHAEAQALVERVLTRFEGERRPPTP